MKRIVLAVGLALIGCAGDVPGGGGASEDGSGGEPTGDGGGGGGGGADAGAVRASCEDRAVLPVEAERPADIMPASRLTKVAERLPCVTDEWLAGILASPDTMWYDRGSIVPGYQDSFGDNVVTPIGMRPNTIESILIDLAVSGGHGWIFAERGVFHFPFGRPIGANDEEVVVVDFWHVPRRDGELLPVVWWMREPNGYTHRLEWLFPAGTVFGELLFLVVDGGEWVPFEIRTRTRQPDRWTVDAFRPFPTAEALAAAIEARRGERAEWASSAELDELVEHLRDDTNLRAGRLDDVGHFDGAFDPIDGAEDVLPGLSDRSILDELLVSTPFESARGTYWKQGGGKSTWAATTEGSSIVPRGYNAGFVEVSDDACATCHRDAGRPFKDWYPDILAYGELWGQDETFSWHPFETSSFVDASGDVVDFNHDNRTFRQDFEDAGLLAPYQPALHGQDTWRQIVREWTNYAY